MGSAHCNPKYKGGRPPKFTLGQRQEIKKIALRQVVGEHQRVTVCFDRGGWSPTLFADILRAGFGLLTYRLDPLTATPPHQGSSCPLRPAQPDPGPLPGNRPRSALRTQPHPGIA
jgi:hypothetical protein